jgi:hypothetical protein
MSSSLHLRRADGTLLPLDVRRCDTFWCRLRGLMFRRNLRDREALLFVESGESRVTASIHMLFVFFSIGVVWLDNQGVVVDKVLARPFRPYYAPQKPACYYLEADPAVLNWIEIGERLTIEEERTSSD